MRFFITILASHLIFLFSGYGQRVIFQELERPMSSYFLIQDNFDAKNFPLLMTKADVTISAMIADVTVTQIYVNRHDKPIEAIYVFPASSRAAVYDMEMKIGKRITRAEIQPKVKAREMYDEARQEGRSASLLEQSRPNVFTMNVANILPGDTITVTLKYTEHLLPESLEYEFVFPTVVGPRFLSKDSPESHAPFDNLAYTEQSGGLIYDFDINVTLNTFVPLASVKSNSHKIVNKQISPQRMLISLDKSEVKSGNRDFILSYKPAGDKIETGLILHEDGRDKYFMLVVQPPKRVNPQEVVPREYIFVIDVSGSMNGFPISISKKAMEQLLRRLRPDDLFNLILFASGTEQFSSQSLPASDKNLADALSFVNKNHGYGGTEIMPALELALNTPVNKGYSKSIVVMTDGLVGVDKEAINYIRENLSNANLYTFGIGSSINRFLLEAMATAGAGEPLIITKPEGAEAMAERFLRYIESPVLTDVSIEFDGFLAYDYEPKKPFDLTAERPIVVYGKYTGTPSGNIKLRGKTANQSLSVNIPVEQFGIMDNSPATKYLFARNQLKLIETYDKLGSRNHYSAQSLFEDVITEIGMKYNLLTEFTSFVAIDYEIRNETGQYEKVHQRLPLPEGMTGSANYASGFGVDMGGFSRNITTSGGATGMGGIVVPSRMAIQVDGFSVDSPLLPLYEADTDNNEFLSKTFLTEDRLNLPIKENDINYDHFMSQSYLAVKLPENILLQDFASVANVYRGKFYIQKDGKLDKITFDHQMEESLRKTVENRLNEIYNKVPKTPDSKPDRNIEVPFAVELQLPDTFRTKFDGKEYPVKFIDFLPVLEIADGDAETVIMGKKASIRVAYLDKDYKEIGSRDYDDILGFGVIPDGISIFANKLTRGSERLIIFPDFYYNKDSFMEKNFKNLAGEIKYIRFKIM